MNNYIPLLKALYKCGTTSSNPSSTNSSGKGGMFGGAASLGLLIVCMIPLIMPITASTEVMYKVLSSSGQQGVIISMGLSYGILTTVITGFTSVMIYFYTTTDLPVLLALPLTPQVIVAVKFTLCLLQEYTMVVISSLPLLFGYGVASGGSILYWILFVLSLILLPVIPLIYGGIIAMLIMRIFKRIRNKNALTVICFAISFLSMFIVIFFQRGAESENAALASATAEKLNGLFIIFPQMIFLRNALIEQDVLQFLLFILTIAVCLAVFLFIANRLYFAGAIGMTEVGNAGRTISMADAEKQLQKSSPVRACARAEAKKILRSPTTLLYGLLMALILPIILIFSIFTGGSSDANSAMGRILAIFTGNAGSEKSLVITIIIFLLTAAVISACNGLTASAFSRMGKEFYTIKVIPVSYRDQVRARILGTVPFTVILFLIYALIPTVTAILHGMTPLVLLYGLLLSVPVVCLTAYIQIFFDLAFVRLVWESENVPLSGFHQIAAGAIAIALSGSAALAGYLLYAGPHLFVPVIVLILFAFLTVLALIARRIVFRYAMKRIRELS